MANPRRLPPMLEDLEGPLVEDRMQIFVDENVRHALPPELAEHQEAASPDAGASSPRIDSIIRIARWRCVAFLLCAPTDATPQALALPIVNATRS
jgi:hypothetical protein